MIGVAWLDVLPLVCDVPSPQVIAYAHGASFTPASLKAAVTVKGLPALAVWFGPAFTTGAAFAMVAVVVVGELDAPRASVMVSDTVYVPLFAYA